MAAATTETSANLRTEVIPLPHHEGPEKYRNATDGTAVIFDDNWLRPYEDVLRARCAIFFFFCLWALGAAESHRYRFTYA